MRDTASLQIEMNMSTTRPLRPDIHHNLMSEPREPLHSHYSDERYHPDKPIFGSDFPVDSMQHPLQFIPNYNQNANNITFMSQCMHCCGQTILGLTYCCPLFCQKCYVYQLQTSSAGLIQSFGKFSRLLKPGFNRINPCSEQVREIDMKIRILSTGGNLVITKDSVKLNIETSVAYRVVNPVQVYYLIGAEMEKSVRELVVASFRNVIGLYLLQDVLVQRRKLITDIMSEVQKSLVAGISIQNIFLENIVIPSQVQSQLSSVAKTRRLAQASIINSRADVQSAEMLRQAAELLDTKAAMQIRYLELVEELGRGGARVVMDIGVQKVGRRGYGRQQEGGGKGKQEKQEGGEKIEGKIQEGKRGPQDNQRRQSEVPPSNHHQNQQISNSQQIL